MTKLLTGCENSSNIDTSIFICYNRILLDNSVILAQRIFAQHIFEGGKYALVRERDSAEVDFSGLDSFSAPHRLYLKRKRRAVRVKRKIRDMMECLAVLVGIAEGILFLLLMSKPPLLPVNF